MYSSQHRPRLLTTAELNEDVHFALSTTADAHLDPIAVLSRTEVEHLRERLMPTTERFYMRAVYRVISRLIDAHGDGHTWVYPPFKRVSRLRQCGWQTIIYGQEDSYVARIVGAGFDGIYLDIIDAFEFFEELN